MVAEPDNNPRTRPASTEAISVLLLLQMPPGRDAENNVVAPSHTSCAPVNGARSFNAYTLISFVAVNVNPDTGSI